jgi:hypothetical protein
MRGRVHKETVRRAILKIGFGHGDHFKYGCDTPGAAGLTEFAGAI